MWTTKLSPTGGDGVAVGVLQHSGRVDGDVTLRVAQDGEDVGRRGGDGALDFDAVGHGVDRVRRDSRVPDALPDQGGGACPDAAALALS